MSMWHNIAVGLIVLGGLAVVYVVVSFIALLIDLSKRTR